MDIAWLAEKRLAWRNSLDEASRAALEAEHASWAVEETKAERLAEFNATFAAADTNNDGVLDRAEFEDFMLKMSQNSAARNIPFQSHDDYSAEEKDGVFALFDNFNGETQGVSA